MKELLISMASYLVDNKDAVNVEVREESDAIIYTLIVDSQDKGKVIGKDGRIAKAIRCVANAVAYQDRKKAVIKIK